MTLKNRKAPATNTALIGAYIKSFMSGFIPAFLITFVIGTVVKRHLAIKRFYQPYRL